MGKLIPNLSLKKQLHCAVVFLSDLGHPQLEAEVLLASVLEKPRVWVKTHDQDKLTILQVLKFKSWVMKRKKGIPLAYIQGYQDWHGQKFLVNKHVLIPRDETETLLQHIFSSWALVDKGSVKTILDVGTGSGCLALELKRFFPEAKVTGLDISEKALAVARLNAKNLNQIVVFTKSDLLSVIPSQSHFDIIVANLPYVPEVIEVTTEVKQEPHSAIFSGPDGLAHLRRFEIELKQKNITFKTLWLEFLPSQKSDIAKIFADYQIEFKADVAGNEFFARISCRD